MSPYSQDAAGPVIYALRAVIIHQGHTSSGHYYCFAYNHSADGWFKLNDMAVSPVNLDHVLNVSRGSGGWNPHARRRSSSRAYGSGCMMLRYELITPEAEPCATPAACLPQAVAFAGDNKSGESLAVLQDSVPDEAVAVVVDEVVEAPVVAAALIQSPQHEIQSAMQVDEKGSPAGVTHEHVPTPALESKVEAVLKKEEEEQEEEQQQQPKQGVEAREEARSTHATPPAAASGPAVVETEEVNQPPAFTSKVESEDGEPLSPLLHGLRLHEGDNIGPAGRDSESWAATVAGQAMLAAGGAAVAVSASSQPSRHPPSRKRESTTGKSLTAILLPFRWCVLDSEPHS